MLQLKKQPKRFFSEKKKRGHMHKFCMNRSIVCKRVHLWAETKHKHLCFGHGAALFSEVPVSGMTGGGGALTQV